MIAYAIVRLKRLFVPRDILGVLDSIIDSTDYTLSFAQRNGKEEAVQLSLAKDYIEVYDKSSGIIVDDYHIKHKSLRLTQKGKGLAITRKNKEIKNSAITKLLGELAVGIVITILGGMLLIFILGDSK